MGSSGLGCVPVKQRGLPWSRNGTPFYGRRYTCLPRNQLKNYLSTEDKEIGQGWPIRKGLNANWQHELHNVDTGELSKVLQKEKGEQCFGTGNLPLCLMV